MLEFVGLCCRTGEEGASKARKGTKKGWEEEEGVPSQGPSALLIQESVLRMIDSHVETWDRDFFRTDALLCVSDSC